MSDPMEPVVSPTDDAARGPEAGTSRGDAGARARERALLLGVVAIHDGFGRLDRAVLDGNPSEDVRQVLGRFALLRKKMEILLEKEGVLRVNSLGQTVNPELHEVIDARTCGEGEVPGTIVDVEEEGYLHKGDVLRRARVVVAESVGSSSV